MHERSPWPGGRARSAAFTAAAVLGLGTALAGASPSAAATVPTLTGPKSVVGFSYARMTGTAEPNAEVRLIEAARIFYDLSPTAMAPATDYGNAGDILETRADSSGNFTLSRLMDSGFVFAAEVKGVNGSRSAVLPISMVARPLMQVTTSGTSVSFTVGAEPNEPFLPVVIQQWNGTGWVTAETGNIPAQPEGPNAPKIPYTATISGLTAGQTMYFRAGLGPSPANDVLLGYSEHPVEIVVGGGSGGPVTPLPTPTSSPTPTPTATSSPTPTQTTSPTPTPTRPSSPTPTPTRPSSPTPTPTQTSSPTPTQTSSPTPTQTSSPTPTQTSSPTPTSSPKPTPTQTSTPKPTPTQPKPVAPKKGEVQFSLVQYDPAGTDRRTNAGYNQEYFRITNKSTRDINLKDWTVKDRSGNTYRFTSFTLYAKKSVYVRTGKGTNGSPSGYRYWGRSSYVWNNSGDGAYLQAGTTLIDTCTWGDGPGRTSC
jgi:hypothetical protein